MKYDTATPYIASYVLLRKGKKIAFVLRSNTAWMNGYYGLPSGKVEKNENYSSAAIREAKEEVGVIIKSKDLKFVHVMHRRKSTEPKEWVDVFFEATKWQGEPYNAEPHIHDELDWLDPAQLPENIVPSVKFALEKIDKRDVFSEYGWDN